MQHLLSRLIALEEKQKPTVHSMKKSIVQYAFRQLADFDKCRALEMAESLKNVALQVKDKKADYYASVHVKLQERISKPSDQFKNYVLSLLGDRDYEKLVEAVNKVDKSYTQGMSGAPHSSDLQSPPPPPSHRYVFPNPPVYHPGAPDQSPQLHYMQSTFLHFLHYPSRRSPRSRNLKSGGATRRNYFCDYCGMNSHILHNCWKRKKDLENKNKNTQIHVSLVSVLCGFLFIII